MDYFFNDLSLATRYLEESKAIDGLKLFVENCRQLGKYYDSLRLPLEAKDLFNCVICNDKLVSQIIHSSDFSSEHRVLLKNIVTKSPFLNENEIEEFTKSLLSEYFFDLLGENKTARGLGAAQIYESIAISFFSNEIWDNNNLNLSKQEYNNDELTLKYVTVKHCASADNLNYHIGKLFSIKSKSIQDGKELILNWESFFPNLILCKTVERQIKKGLIFFTQVKNKLIELENYCATWTTGGFELNKLQRTTSLNVSDESESTVNRYGDQRRFILPNGKSELFSLHIKSGGFRIHFYPEDAEQKIYIGYIGKHLPIVSEN